MSNSSPRKMTFLEMLIDARDDGWVDDNDEPEKNNRASVKGDLSANKLEEINRFYSKHNRLPLASSKELTERKLAWSLNALQRNKEHYKKLAAFDTYGLLTCELPIESNVSDIEVVDKSELVTSFQDILEDDDEGLYSSDNDDIFVLKHVPAQKREQEDENAKRKPCLDFHRFSEMFEIAQHGLKIGAFTMTRFKHRLKIRKGDFFVLNGVLGYVDEIGEWIKTKEEKRLNARLRVIFENGMELDMLYLSLTHGLVRDKSGRKVQLNGRLLGPVNEPLLTGYIYVLKTQSCDPALAPYKKELYKIGLTKHDVEGRIKNAEKEKTYLEAPVEIVMTAKCFDVNLATLEKLIHAFLYNQRLNIVLQDIDGQQYRPREWFTVPLDTIEQVIKYILDGTISQYRMNNITRKIVKK